MTWPAFDIGEAINQLISGAATVGGVLFGGFLAFRLGIRQLRRERAIDRRVEWHEKLIAALSEYRSFAVVFLTLIENSQAENNEERRHQALIELSQRGRTVDGLLPGAQLYGTLTEQQEALTIFGLHTDLLTESWAAHFEPKHATRNGNIRRVIESLGEAQRRLIESLRAELDIEQARSGSFATLVDRSKDSKRIRGAKGGG